MCLLSIVSTVYSLQQWYSSLWDRFDDWLRERIEVHLNTEQIGMFNEMLEVIFSVCWPTYECH